MGTLILTRSFLFLYPRKSDSVVSEVILSSSSSDVRRRVFRRIETTCVSRSMEIIVRFWGGKQIFFLGSVEVLFFFWFRFRFFLGSVFFKFRFCGGKWKSSSGSVGEMEIFDTQLNFVLPKELCSCNDLKSIYNLFIYFTFLYYIIFHSVFNKTFRSSSSGSVEGNSRVRLVKCIPWDEPV